MENEMLCPFCEARKGWVGRDAPFVWKSQEAGYIYDCPCGAKATYAVRPDEAPPGPGARSIELAKEAAADLCKSCFGGDPLSCHVDATLIEGAESQAVVVWAKARKAKIAWWESKTPGPPPGRSRWGRS